MDLVRPVGEAERADAGAEPPGPSSLDEWRVRHPGLHPYETLREALERRYELRELEWRPYLYRWLGSGLDEEAAEIAAGRIRAIGYRIAAARR